ncbi:hypothetical protein DYB32_003614 [Aphanomyces invadans]|uniref:Choline transporter-like protein n=1 Tax=Aphanomyces invadans TaxID=157072 RepID=A0A3R6ZSA0_9STRA|nr:hypothetical protein DYB32_003614 [Aphanomyces invadans]
MGCCSSKDDVIPDGTGGSTPTHTRKCRDVLCCVVFLVFWLGMAVLAIVGVSNGTPERLLFGTDFNGTVCGTGRFQDSTYLYFPRINDDLLAQTAHGIAPLDMKFYGLCVPSCPVQGDYICAYTAEAQIRAANPSVTDPAGLKALRAARANSLSNRMGLTTADCWSVALPSEVVAFRCLPVQVTVENTTEVCVDPGDSPEYYKVSNGVQVPNDKCNLKKTLTRSETVGQANSNPIFDKMQSAGALVGRFIADIQKTYGELLGIGGGGALVLGWLFLFFMKCCAGCVIWFVLVVVVLLLAILSAFFLVKGGIIHSSDISAVTTAVDVQVPATLAQSHENAKVYQGAAVVSIVLTVIALLIVCFMRKRIKIAIGIIREASRAIQRLPFLVLFPLIPVVLILGLFIYATVIGAYIYSADGNVSLTAALASVGVPTSNATTSLTTAWAAQLNATTTTSAAVQPKQLMQIMVAYHFFGFLWTNQVIQAISMTTIAGAVSKYYWSRDHTAAQMGRFPVLSAFTNCFRYHFGSLAFGSFIIAVVQFVRAVLMYVDRQTKQLQKSNVAVLVALKAVACCLWCLEKVLKFISKNAYIVIAMKGRSFCGATREAFSLIFANMAQVAITSTIVNMVVVVARVAISVGCALLLFLYLDHDAAFDVGGARELSSVFPPVVLGFVLAWFVAGTFLGVYEMCVDTILLCFCEDRRINNETGQYYMSKELAAFVDKVAKAKKAVDGEGAPPPASTERVVEVSPKKEAPNPDI